MTPQSTAALTKCQRDLLAAGKEIDDLRHALERERREAQTEIDRLAKEGTDAADRRVKELEAAIDRKDAAFRLLQEQFDQVKTQTEFVTVESAEFENFYEEVRGKFGKKYPGSVDTLETFDGMLRQYVQSKQVKK